MPPWQSLTSETSKILTQGGHISESGLVVISGGHIWTQSKVDDNQRKADRDPKDFTKLPRPRSRQ